MIHSKKDGIGKTKYIQKNVMNVFTVI